MKRSNQILTSKDEIMEYLGCSKYKLKKWISMGLPVLVVDGSMIAHTDNLENFFRSITRVRLKDYQDPDDESLQDLGKN